MNGPDANAAIHNLNEHLAERRARSETSLQSIYRQECEQFDTITDELARARVSRRDLEAQRDAILERIKASIAAEADLEEMADLSMSKMHQIERKLNTRQIEARAAE